MAQWDKLLEKVQDQPARSLALNADELLLLDAVLVCPNPGEETHREWYMRWQEFRQQIWQLIFQLDPCRPRDDNPPKEALQKYLAHTRSLYPDMEDVPTLLAIIPPTARWGAGEDCAYSLKLKLYQYISGEVLNAATSEDADKDKADAKGDASNDAVA